MMFAWGGIAGWEKETGWWLEVLTSLTDEADVGKWEGRREPLPILMGAGVRSELVFLIPEPYFRSHGLHGKPYCWGTWLGRGSSGAPARQGIQGFSEQYLSKLVVLSLLASSLWGSNFTAVDSSKRQEAMLYNALSAARVSKHPLKHQKPNF